jgi:LacI family transcriptional regulator
MHQHNDVVGEAAVDMLIQKTYRLEAEEEDFPRATMIGATWVDGPSVRQQKTKKAPRKPAKRAAR